MLNFDETRGITIGKLFKKYDWETMCPVYDRLFSSLTKQNN